MKLVSIKLVIEIFSMLLFRPFIFMSYGFVPNSNVKEGSPTPISNSLTSAGCLAIQLNSDTIHPEIASDSTG